MDGYIQFLKEQNCSIFDDSVKVTNFNIELKPWSFDNSLSFHLWWTAYNKIKHERYNIVAMYGEKDYKKIQKELFNLRCEYLIKDEDIKKVVCKKIIFF